MEWINEIIMGLMEIYNTSCPYELCDILDIAIFKVKPSNPILASNNSVYIREHQGRETIFIRNDLSHRYELFYLRHELGHAILHPNIMNSYNKHLINKGKLERQANYFALKLQELDIDIDVLLFNEMTLEQIASCVEVPYDALKQLANI